MDNNLVFDKERFVGACNLVALIEAENGYTQPLVLRKGSKRVNSRITREGESNIGGLGEGTLHLVLKNYISANRLDQEVEYEKKFIDVFLDGKAYEIQTRSFSSLKSKLKTFLPHISVCVIFPAIREKRICWTDPETGEVSDFRKSPKKENVYSIFRELVYIKDFLSCENLSFCVFELACNETKLLSGRSYDRKKFGAVRLNRVPTDLFGIEYFENSKDFLRLLPKETEFSAKILSQHAKTDINLARQMLYCLNAAGVITHVRTEKREKYYTISD